MDRRRFRTGLVAGAALALAAAATPAFSNGASLAPTLPHAQPASASVSALLASSTPKTVVLDPATGATVSVQLGEPPAVAGGFIAGARLATPAITGNTNCQPGDGCYYTPTVSGIYHNRSFYGSPGTFTGNWPHRNAWTSGNYTAYVCWTSACSQWYGPNTYVTFGGSLVTGTSFTIG